jgi:hypothetical protein
MALSPATRSGPRDSRGRSPGRDQDLVEDRIGLAQYVVVPEADHSKSGMLQPSGPRGVVARAVEMLPAVEFDHQPRTESDEIDDPRTNRLLPAELDARQPASAKVEPQSPLGIGGP